MKKYDHWYEWLQNIDYSKPTLNQINYDDYTRWSKEAPRCTTCGSLYFPKSIKRPSDISGCQCKEDDQNIMTAKEYSEKIERNEQI